MATPVEEFKATLNRHAECTDCHNPHSSFISTGKPLSTMTATGWTASGRIQRVSGVAVTNGAAGQAPTSYTFLNGVTDPLSAEYQLCFKCHSSYTTLPAGAADIALEFNPAVKSYHPVEAPGKNTSTAMANSLAGTSSYKIWSFKVGDTVRCLHCHASGTKTEVTTSGSTIVPQDPHAVPNTSPNRDGILLLNYRRSDTRALELTSRATTRCASPATQWPHYELGPADDELLSAPRSTWARATPARNATTACTRPRGR